MKRGILYFAWGNFDLPLLRRSVESVRENSDLPVCLVTDQPHSENSDLFDQIRVELHPPCDLLSKARMYELSPFEETCFLDLDTIVLRPIELAWQYVSLHKMAVCIAPAFHFGNYYAVQGVAELDEYFDITIYNTGVIFFSKTPSNEQVFALWEKYNREHSFRCDQPGFAMAIHASNTNPYVLPRTWNFRSSNRHVGLHRDGHGPIFIWHNRKLPPSDLTESGVSPWTLDTIAKKQTATT